MNPQTMTDGADSSTRHRGTRESTWYFLALSVFCNSTERKAITQWTGING